MIRRLFGAKPATSATDDAPAAALTPDMMREHAAHRDVTVREALARRTDLSLGVVIVLSDDDKSSVRQALASNPAVVKAPSAVDVLARDKDTAVALALIANPAISADVVEVMAASRRGVVRDAALQRLGRAANDVPQIADPEWEEETVSVTIEDPRTFRSKR